MDLISGEARPREERLREERLTGAGRQESSAGARRIEVEVRELVFHGFSAAEARRVAASLEEELGAYLATELSRGLSRKVDGELAPQLAEGIEKTLEKAVEKAVEKARGTGRGDHRSGTDRREHHGR
jgi:hypothetical protein